MIPPERIREALGRLIGWLDSWRTSEGAYHGFVVHRFETKRMGRIHDTAWTQAAIIRGLSNLVRKTGQDCWMAALSQSADIQAVRLDRETGKYRYAGHEDDRFCSLVHCALANCALLEVVDLVDRPRRERYIEAVRINTEKYMLGLWVPQHGAFKFSEIDHWSPGEDRFVINFNTMAAESLLRLTEVTGEASYRERAEQVGRWLLETWQLSRQPPPRHYIADYVEDEPRRMPPGGLPYQRTASQPQPDDYVTIYAGLALRGIAALHRATGRAEFGEIATTVGRWLLSMRDPQTRLFYHTAKDGHIVPYPQFIAGAGMTLVGLHEIRELLGIEVPAADTVEAILDRTYHNGAAAGFIGKDIHRPGGRLLPVWEDAVPTVNWNAQWFEFLTRLADSEPIEPVAPVRVRRLTRRFYFEDTSNDLRIVSWWPRRSACLYAVRKRHRRAWLWVGPWLLRTLALPVRRPAKEE